MIGTRLGPYEITGKLGEGGMGEVYRATDTKLERQVAIKVLPSEFTADPERLARFEREAKLLAQLHHPNIASIFGLEESDGTRALVMELVEGPTLAERLESGALPFNESLSVSLQIAHALEEAHEKGIVHRDLKPQNIKASIEGKVKVLDFGLAKAMDPAGAGSGAGSASQLAKSPTLTMGATQMGVILGTAAYMSPEQAKGFPIDKRADIWAFGVVLYEMLVGGSLFSGDSVGDTLAAVIRAEIDLGRLPDETPSAIRSLLRRCLERNPKNRLHDIADARIVLEEAVGGKLDEPVQPGPPTAAPAVARSTPWLLAVGTLLAGLLIGGVAVRFLAGGASATSSAPAARFAVSPPAGTSFQRGLAISPDGRQLAFTARDPEGRVALWVRPIDALEARKLPETDDARFPFWAPDSRRLGYFSRRRLMWIDLAGGSPLEIAPTSSVQDVRGAAWGAGDTILYAPSFIGPLLAISVKGGKGVPAVSLPADGSIGTQRFPHFLPDGRRFVYYASGGTGTEPGALYLGRLGSLEAKLLGPSRSMALYGEPGYLLFVNGEALYAQRFDDAKEELVGSPVALGVPMGGSLAVSGLRSISLSRGGALVYRDDKRNASQLVWVDRAGRELEAVTDTQSSWNYAPRLSPDGRLLLVGRYALPSATLGEIWVYDLARRLASRVSFDEGDDYLALWLRPGSEGLLFESARPGNAGGIYRKSLSRPGEEQLWLPGETTQNPAAVTPDGHRVIFERDEGLGRFRLWIRDLEGNGEPARLGSATANEVSPDVSPDGRWLAYASDATRNWEVYVRRLDGQGGVVRISGEGGTHPLWRHDGRELFYLDWSGRLVAVPISQSAGDPGTAGAVLRPGLPQVLFPGRLEEASDRQFDVSADGQRLLLNRSVANDDLPVVVTLDWRALLERKTP
ncbi:MAG TPA: protein kinase [Thermoanaerobaculia bacterium]